MAYDPILEALNPLKKESKPGQINDIKNFTLVQKEIMKYHH